jgi:hypothetical protein
MQFPVNYYYIFLKNSCYKINLFRYEETKTLKTEYHIGFKLKYDLNCIPKKYILKRFK